MTFGQHCRALRLKNQHSLRQAAQKLGISAAYLSRVENDEESPSGPLLVNMATLYGETVEDLTRFAREKSESLGKRVTISAHGHNLTNTAELRALYRLGNQLDPEAVDDLIRNFLRDHRGMTDDAQIEAEIRRLKMELPRLARGQDELFAAAAKPRLLSKKQLAVMAHGFLARHGLTQDLYAPPTRVDMLVEMEPEIEFRIDDLPQTKKGNHLVLGLSRWSTEGKRQIVISSKLADSRRETEIHRFNFTVAHELFHAIEHLPRLKSWAQYNRAIDLEQSYVLIESSVIQSSSTSPAVKAVQGWINQDGRRRLLTDEDWREWQANTFASMLLMPEWAVKEEFVSRTGSEEIVVSEYETKQVAFQLAGEKLFESAIYAQSMAQKFSVSTQAMAIRLLEIGLVREE